MEAPPPNHEAAAGPERGRTGVTLLVFVLLGSFLLVTFFFWVLFFSPGGSYERVRLDFNKLVPVDSKRLARPKQPEIRVAIASMVSPEDSFDVYGNLIRYLGEKLHRTPRAVQRLTYREVNELIIAGKIDLGFICTGPYLEEMDKGEIIALVVPVVYGKTYYRAYVIVPRTAPYETLEDLRGKAFALMDDDSLTGRMYPNALLGGMGEAPDRFFGNILRTHSHSDSIHAVSFALADGASVSSIVYDYYQRWDPEKTRDCRILMASEPMGMPPVVVSGKTPEPLREGIRNIFLGMDKDPRGKEILNRMNTEAFVPAETIRGLYEETRTWLRSGDAGNASAAAQEAFKDSQP